MSQLAIDDATIEQLRSAVGGEVITPEDAAYEEARRVWNGMIDRHPALIVRCTSDRRRGRRGQLRPRERPDRLRARRRALDARLQHLRRRDRDRPAADERRRGRSRGARPRACRAARSGPTSTPPRRSTGWRSPAAACPTPASAASRSAAAAAGSSGMYGVTCESLLSAEVVTADGSVVRASADENPDLFWGLRGGGGNFGVVTEFEFRLHPVGPIVMGGMLAVPARAGARDHARLPRLHRSRRRTRSCGGLALITAPPEEFVPEEVRGQPAVGIVFCYVGPPEEGEEALRPLREALPSPSLDMVQPMPYTALQQMLDAGNPHGIREYFKVDWLRELPDEAIDVIVEQAEELPAPFGQLILAPMGGAVGRTDNERAGADRSRRAVGLLLPDDVDGPGRGRAQQRLDARLRRGDAAVRDRHGGLPELHRARRGQRAAARVLRRGQVRAARRAEAASGTRTTSSG